MGLILTFKSYCNNIVIAGVGAAFSVRKIWKFSVQLSCSTKSLGERAYDAVFLLAISLVFDYQIGFSSYRV